MKKQPTKGKEREMYQCPTCLKPMTDDEVVKWLHRKGLKEFASVYKQVSKRV